jgi:hypothetical protein
MTITVRSKSLYLISWTDVSNVKDGTTEGRDCKDNIATDLIEELPLSLEAPGPILRSGGGSVSRIGSSMCEVMQYTNLRKDFVPD